ncbi:MAG: hypothetical protein ACREX3_18230, partial [Gammaproteobacteria bacterium]
QLLGDWTADRLRRLQSEAHEAEAARLKAATTLEVVLRRRDHVLELRTIRHHLHALRSAAPDLLARLEAVDSAISQVNQDRERLQREIMALAARVATAEPVLQELRNARRTLERNRAKLSTSLNKAAVIAADLGVEPVSEDVTALRHDLESAAMRLREEQTALDSAPIMRQMLDGITVELADAERRGLSDQVLIDDPETDLQLTVSQARTGMSARRSYLEGQPPPPQAREVSEQLASVHLRIARTRDLKAVLDDADRHRRLVRENEERVDRAVSATDPKAVSKLQELESLRREKDDRLLGLAAERASLRQQLGTVAAGDTDEQLESRLVSGAREVGVSIERLDDAIALAEKESIEAQAALAVAEDHSVRSRRDVARATAEVRRATATITGRGEWSWLRTALPTAAVPDADLPIDQQLLALDLIRDRLTATAERLGTHRIQMAAVENALRAVARHLRGQDPAAIEYVQELQDWFGRRFSDWFNGDRVRAELLPEADGSIVVDLSKRDVEWAAGGAPRSRPLDAFSSGEQAFAYTRARLAVLDEERPRPLNRLVFLDEFGAFIAHDRFSGLLAYLRDRTTTHPEDQVLVILPLTRDYREMAQNAIGPEALRLDGLAQAIETRGFAVQVLSN